MQKLVQNIFLSISSRQHHEGEGRGGEGGGREFFASQALRVSWCVLLLVLPSQELTRFGEGKPLSEILEGTRKVRARATDADEHDALVRRDVNVSLARVSYLLFTPALHRSSLLGAFSFLSICFRRNRCSLVCR